MMQRFLHGLGAVVCVVSMALLCTGCGEDQPEGASGGGASGIKPIEHKTWARAAGAGDYAIGFTVRFGRKVDSGTVIQLGRARPGASRAFACTEGFPHRLEGSGSEVMVRWQGLAPGEYQVFARVDVTGDPKLGSGDLGGYYVEDGTPGVIDPAKASVIEITDHDVTGLEFTLGEIP